MFSPNDSKSNDGICIFMGQGLIFGKLFSKIPKNSQKIWQTLRALNWQSLGNVSQILGPACECMCIYSRIVA